VLRPMHRERGEVQPKKGKSARIFLQPIKRSSLGENLPGDEGYRDKKKRGSGQNACTRSSTIFPKGESIGKKGGTATLHLKAIVWDPGMRSRVCKKSWRKSRGLESGKSASPHEGRTASARGKLRR